MKTSLGITAAVLLSLGAFCSAHAQTYVLESKVLLTSALLTQGTSKTVNLPPGRGTVVITKSITRTPFNNQTALAEMIGRGLITGATGDWTLLYLSDPTGTGGVYASKPGTVPVAVPADLVTAPVFGASLVRGTEATANGGDGERRRDILGRNAARHRHGFCERRSRVRPGHERHSHHHRHHPGRAV